MAQITTALIQELREKTNAGMMDCKKALQEADGNIEDAVAVLRKRGIAKAAKRSDREASEGLVKIKLNATSTEAYILELNSETDFVSKNESFQKLSSDLMDLLEKSKAADTASFLKETLPNGKSVQTSVDEFSGIIGEKIVLKRVQLVTVGNNDTIGAYTHSNNKIGVVIGITGGKGQEELAKDLCMHIAASNPSFIGINDVPSDELDKEKAILKEQAINAGKPEAIAEKIVEGKLRKYYEDNCLLEQDFVKDSDKKIKDLLNTMSVSEFVRFSIG